MMEKLTAIENSLFEIVVGVAEKFGVFIYDFDNNLFPYIQDLSSRVRQYLIVESCITILFGISLLLISSRNLRKTLEMQKLDLSQMTFFVLCFFLAICSYFIILIGLVDLVKVLVVPEIVIIDYLSEIQ